MRSRGTLNASSVQEGTAELSYREIADVVRQRHGWTMSTVRVRQICLSAERKMKSALRGWNETDRPEDW